MGITDRTPGAAGEAPKDEEGPLWKRLAWLVMIWAGSVAALGAVAYVLRLWIAP